MNLTMEARRRDATQAGKPPPVWKAGVDAARQNLWPGLMLSAFAVALLLSYWYVPAVTGALQAVADFKERQGWWFVVVSTATFGGAIPWLVQRVRPSSRGLSRWSHLWFLLAFWGIKGLEVDLFYKWQAVWFGDGSDPATLAKKIFVDMGVYCPIWAVPSTVAAYAWKDNGFSWRGLGRVNLRRWVVRVLVPILVSNWSVWVPAVVVIYCLPLALQLPVQNLVLCFWSLLLVFQVAASRDELAGEAKEGAS